jgi:hypothetical protein
MTSPATATTSVGLAHDHRAKDCATRRSRRRPDRTKRGIGKAVTAVIATLVAGAKGDRDQGRDCSHRVPSLPLTPGIRRPHHDDRQDGCCHRRGVEHLRYQYRAHRGMRFCKGIPVSAYFVPGPRAPGEAVPEITLHLISSSSRSPASRTSCPSSTRAISRVTAPHHGEDAGWRGSPATPRRQQITHAEVPLRRRSRPGHR